MDNARRIGGERGQQRRVRFLQFDFHVLGIGRANCLHGLQDKRQILRRVTQGLERENHIFDRYRIAVAEFGVTDLERVGETIGGYLPRLRQPRPETQSGIVGFNQRIADLFDSVDRAVVARDEWIEGQRFIGPCQDQRAAAFDLLGLCECRQRKRKRGDENKSADAEASLTVPGSAQPTIFAIRHDFLPGNDCLPLDPQGFLRSRCWKPASQTNVAAGP